MRQLLLGTSNIIIHAAPRELKLFCNHSACPAVVTCQYHALCLSVCQLGVTQGRALILGEAQLPALSHIPTVCHGFSGFLGNNLYIGFINLYIITRRKLYFSRPFGGRFDHFSDCRTVLVEEVSNKWEPRCIAVVLDNNASYVMGYGLVFLAPLITWEIGNPREQATIFTISRSNIVFGEGSAAYCACLHPCSNVSLHVALTWYVALCSQSISSSI